VQVLEPPLVSGAEPHAQNASNYTWNLSANWSRILSN